MNECAQIDASEPALPASSRLPGVGYWFSEDSSFAFGLMVDLSKFESYDQDALFDRFYARLVSEYDRLVPHVDAARTYGITVRSVDHKEQPLSISLPSDETLFLQIMPASIQRTELLERLPGVLTEFVRMLGEDWQPADD